MLNRILNWLSAFHAAKPSGRALNVGVSMFEPYYLMHSIWGEAFTSIEAIRDGGMALEIDGDDPDFATLRAADIKPGHCRTCIAEGAFRLGGPPAFPVTVDAVGDKLRSRSLSSSELAGAVRCGDYHRGWLTEIQKRGLLTN